MKNTKFNIVCSIIGFILALLSSITMSFGFVKSGFELSAKYNEKVSAYEKTEYDYIVYSPVESQIAEMKNEKSVKEVFEYYLYNSTVTFGDKEFTTKSMFSSNVESLHISSFNDSRILKGSYSLLEKNVYLDDIVAKELGASVGDVVNISLGKGVILNLTVSAIFETNTLFENGSIFFTYSGDNKSSIDSKRTVSLSGALIQANGLQECFEYLKTYKPYGEMLSRDYFGSDLEYEQYVDDFENADYSSRIFKKHTYLESIQQSNYNLLKSADSKIKTGAIIASIMMLFEIFMSIYAIKFESNFEKQTKTSIPNKKYRIGVNSITMVSYVLNFVFTLAFTLSMQNKILVYGNLLGSVLGTTAISLVISLLTTLIITNIVLSKVNNKKMNAIHIKTK